jgi:hypothetical protein
MTKEEILKIIDQNRDVLTPENYQGILKNADIFTEEEKKRIVEYLTSAQSMIRANEDFLKRRNALLKKSVQDLKEAKDLLIEKLKQAREEEGKRQERDDKSQADGLLNDL